MTLSGSSLKVRGEASLRPLADRSYIVLVLSKSQTNRSYMLRLAAQNRISIGIVFQKIFSPTMNQQHPARVGSRT